MLLTVTSVKEHKGFMLSSQFDYEENLVVLTGKNGCGKTRFLESIQNLSSAVTLSGVSLVQQDIKHVDQLSLQPNFSGNYKNDLFDTKITSTLQLFDSIKKELDLPLNLENARTHSRASQEGALPYDSLYNLCASISKKRGKQASELSHSEIRLYFEDHMQELLGFQNISLICNQYIKRKKLNKYNRYLAEVEKEDIAYLSEDLFLDEFGKEPWKIINQIVGSIFDGKFQFSLPDIDLESCSYNATLLQPDNGITVTAETLSSGEKTLLWLALTLFNSQYYDRDAVKSIKLLLIDEPDAFLHPQMVNKMYRVLDTFSKNFNSKVIITTHSPTTVALAPDKSVHVVTKNSVTLVGRDEAVTELLDGVTQISISPENRRQVFVESQYDVDVYQYLFTKIVHKSKLLDPKISLNFVSSGPKLPKQQIVDAVKKIFGDIDNQKIDEVAMAINGVGNCSQVVGQVEALAQNNHGTVRGIIDWDTTNNPMANIAVLGHDYAYSIENIALDPICILLLLHIDKPDVYTMTKLCGSETTWDKWLKNSALLQQSIDLYMEKVLGEKSDKKSEISYISGLTLLTDSGYLKKQGHSLEDMVTKAYPELNRHKRSGKNGELKLEIIKKSMVNLTNCSFIPSSFELVFSKVQK